MDNSKRKGKPYTENFYGTLAHYYDMTHRWRDYRKQVNFLDSVFRHHGRGIETVMDICCGTGEHAILLAERGYQVDGIDISEEMLEIANRKAQQKELNISFIKQDVLHLDPGKKKFDAAYCLGFTFHYMTTYQKAICLLENLFVHLLPSGLLVVDLISPWKLLDEPQKDKYWCEEGGARIVYFENTAIDKVKRVKRNEFFWFILTGDGNLQLERTEEELKIFFQDELEFLLENNGFHVLEMCSAYQLGHYAFEEAGEIVVIAQRAD